MQLSAGAGRERYEKEVPCSTSGAGSAEPTVADRAASAKIAAAMISSAARAAPKSRIPVGHKSKWHQPLLAKC